MSQFNEDNAVEQLFIETLKKNGWKYIPAEQLDRELSDVMVESMVKNALIRLNPEIEENQIFNERILSMMKLKKSDLL